MAGRRNNNRLLVLYCTSVPARQTTFNISSYHQLFVVLFGLRFRAKTATIPPHRQALFVSCHTIEKLQKSEVKKKTILFLTFVIIFISYTNGQINNETKRDKSIPIKIQWSENLNGNFSFKNKWSYSEEIFKNKFGQLSCDGFCPPETYEMLDSNGRIKKDSIKSFYKIVDTLHRIHSINSSAWCYEWAGTDFIEIEKKSNDKILCKTEINASTHCSLEIEIIGDSCFVLIDLISIMKGGNAKYFCTNGTIVIDKPLWKKGIMKAVFNFNFEHLENPKKPIYWKGKIYSKIKKIRPS